MLETEFKKEIKKLSDNYSFAEIDSSITGPKLLVSYKGDMVLRIYKSMQYQFSTLIKHDHFYQLPFSNKLWMLAAEFAMTPVDKRFKENEYNVIIAHTGFYLSTAWYKVAPNTQIYDVDNIDNTDLSLPEYKFTTKEYKELIKYIKTLPDGEFQIKVAEHGKTLVGED